MNNFITYYRVSTKKQGQSGLGLDAQRETVRQYLKANNGQEIESYTEIESGTNGNRPVLKSAIQKCKDTGATLLIAKLDRLSRNVAFLFTLKEELESAGTRFVAADIPDVDNVMVLAALASYAQQEAERISQRIKDAIHQHPKYQADEWGNPYDFSDEQRSKGVRMVMKNARQNKANRHAFHFIQPRRQTGQSYGSIANQLNEEGYRTRYGKQFNAAAVRRLWLMFTEEKDKGSDLTLKQLKACAKDLNDELGLEPPIDLSLKRPALIELLKEAGEMVMPDDQIKPETIKTLKSLGISVGISDSKRGSADEA